MRKIQNVKYTTMHLPSSITGGSVDEELGARMEIGRASFLCLYGTKTKSHNAGELRAAGTYDLSMSFAPSGEEACFWGAHTLGFCQAGMAGMQERPYCFNR